jgi:hypothetical protein
MTELIEKTSWRQRMDEMLDHQKLGDYIPDDESASTLMDYIAKEVELAYKAGMLHFNALDHTLLDTSSVEQALDEEDIWKEKWVQSEGWSTGTPVQDDLLVSLYLQAKGFKR